LYLLWEAFGLFSLLSSFDLSVIALGWLEPRGWTALITWQQSSLRWRHEDTDSEDSLDDLEAVATLFPLSCIGLGASVINLLLAWEDCMGETTWSAWEIGFFGGGRWGNGKEAVDQSWWWTTSWWTISCQPSLVGSYGCIHTWGGTQISEKFWCG